MKCTSPRSVHPWTRAVLQGHPNPAILVDCGKCLSCRINKAREWTLRLNHEAQLAKTTYFLTLTYDEEHLPEGQNVCKADVESFISDLRKICGPGLRYFIGSEYGESPTSDHRPHYHGLFFNVPEWIAESPCSGSLRVETRRGKSNSVSRVNTYFNDIWNKGFVTVGSFHPRRAGYLAHYYVDKQDSPPGRTENFSLMSRRPGIGNSYALSISDKLVAGSPLYGHTGRPVASPRYYRGVVQKLTGEVKVRSDDQRLIDKINESKYITKSLGKLTEAQLKKTADLCSKSQKQI